MISASNLNALSEDLVKDLLSSFEYLSNDDSTKVIILTGIGKSFISGADIKDFPKKSYQFKLKKTENLISQLIKHQY